MADAPKITATIREPGAVARQLNDHLDTHIAILAEQGFDFDEAVAQRRYEADALGSAGITVDPKPGTINHLPPGTPVADEVWSSFKVDHITSVTVALGCTLVLDVIGVRPDRAEPVTLSLRAEGGTAIGVPSVAVDRLRSADLVL